MGVHTILVRKLTNVNGIGFCCWLLVLVPGEHAPVPLSVWLD